MTKMKKTIDVKTVRDGLWMDTNVTYAQVPGWLGNTTRDLKLTVIRHFQNDSDKRYPVIFWFEMCIRDRYGCTISICGRINYGGLFFTLAYLYSCGACR